MLWRRNVGRSQRPISQGDILSSWFKFCKNQIGWNVKYHRIRPYLCTHTTFRMSTLQWRHNERDVVWNHRRLDALLTHLFRRRSKNVSKLRIIGLCEGNPPVSGGFPSQRVSNTENYSISWRHHETSGTITWLQQQTKKIEETKFSQEFNY